jgi:hypothetical protein
MKNTALFSTMDAEQLRVVNGGGFAFDLGRVIRFIGLTGGGVNTTYAIIDWIINDAANEGGR